MEGCPRIVLAGVVLVLTIGSGPIARAEPPADAIRIARLIDDLGDRQYVRREQASSALQQAGDAAREQLQAAAESNDPEVRLRAKSLLRSLQREDLWRASRVKLPRARADASDMVLAIAEQSGNRIYLGDSYGTFEDVPVELPVEGELWPLLDTLCRQSGNRVRPHYGVGREGLVLVGGTLGEFPVAYSGPIRAQITTAKREFSEELDYEANKSKLDHKFQLNLLLTWEDRFRLVAAKANVDLVEATTVDGKDVRTAQAASTQWNVFDSSSRQMGASLKLEPPSADAPSLAKLVIAWDMIAIGQFARLSLDDLVVNQRYRQDDVIAMLHRVEDLGGGRWEIEVSIARELPVPEPEEVLYRENTFELLDQQGQLMRPNGQSNLPRDAGVARHALTFRGEQDSSRPAKLIIHYPRLRDRRLMRIEFNHVTLPVAKPE